MESNKSYPLKFFSLRVAAVCLFLLTTLYGMTELGLFLLSGNNTENNEQREASASQIFIKGDTSRGVFVLEDTATGMVWIGIPGVNRIK